MKRFKSLIFSLSFILLFLFGINFILRANQNNDLKSTLTITTYFDEKEKITNQVVVNQGSKLSFEKYLINLENYQLAFYLVDGFISEKEINKEYTITSDTELTLIFKPLNKNVVLFMDEDIGLLDIQYVLPGESAKEPDITLPEKPGYQAIWNHSLENIETDTIIKLIYELVYVGDYELTVYGGKITSQEENIVTIEAYDISGLHFNYWLINNQIISKTKTYRFTVFEDTTISAIYSKDKFEESPYINLIGPIAEDTYKGQFYLPNNYTLVEFGVLVGDVKHQATLDNEATKEFIIILKDINQNIKAYLTYQDAENISHTIYNEFIDTTKSFNINVSASDFPSYWKYEKVKLNTEYWAFEQANAWVETCNYNFNGQITFTMNALGTGNMPSNTFKIEAFDKDGFLVEASNNISISEAGIQGNYQNFSYQFKNLNNDISYFRLTFNKENSGTNLRIKSISIEGGTSSKPIINISASLLKTKYYVEDELDLTNGKLTINYDDNTSETIPLTQEMVFNFKTDNQGNYSLFIYYQGHIDKINYSVSKRIPQYEVPVIKPIKHYTGLKLNDIQLPKGFTWNEPDTLLEIGTSEHLVTYTPDNTNKYEIITNIVVTVNVLENIIDTDILIYEVYAGGGNNGAIYNHDFIILYNTTYEDIDLSGYSIQYAPETSSDYTVYELSGIIKAQDFYLIQLGTSNKNQGSKLPVNPNISFNLNIATSGGKLALVKSLEPIPHSKHSTIVDFIGYGNANEYEKEKAPALNSTTSAKRHLFIDTNNNKFDFHVNTVDLTYFINSLELIGISVSNLKSTYPLNAELDLTDALLILKYSNGMTNTLPLNINHISGFYSSNLGTYELTITYLSFVTTHPYTIVDYSSLDNAYVYYIDVGSTGGKAGEATLIKIGDIEVLIDAGDTDSDSKDALLNFLDEKVFDGTIEYVIASHPDSDHIGGMEIVYTNYTVLNTILYSTTNANPSQLALNFVDLVEEQSETIYYIYDIVNSNSIIELEEGYILKFYDTNYLTSSNNNASSIVFTFEAFDTRVLFNGDAEEAQEIYYAPLVGDVDIFKLGHHGSSKGTSTFLLEHITPEVAIVTNGDYLGNQYFHPTYEAVARIYEYSNLIPVYAVTGGNGSDSDRNYQRNGHITITINNNGYEIYSEHYQYNPIELSKTDYWKSEKNNYRHLGYYYADATGILDKHNLRQALHDIIKNHHSISYDDVKDAFKITEEDPNNPNNVLLLYTGYSQSKNTFGGNSGQYNREHVWPNSHGIHDKRPAYSDLHHLRATNVNVNSKRGNLDFGVSVTRTKVSANYGPNSSYSYIDNDSLFEPRDEVKGDVARMLFYMDVRYEGTNNEPDLKLVNGKTSNNTNLLGDLQTLLQWHLDDPVDNWERNRNNLVYGIQKNRNPFIDIPKFALIIFN